MAYEVKLEREADDKETEPEVLFSESGKVLKQEQEDDDEDDEEG